MRIEQELNFTKTGYRIDVYCTPEDGDNAEVYRRANEIIGRMLGREHEERKAVFDEHHKIVDNVPDTEQISLDNSGESGIITSGAVSGALDPDSVKASEHAERYYESVRHMTGDVDRIAKNTEFSKEDISNIKHFVFLEKHDLGNGIPENFAPNYAMAESWQRLIDGKNIQPHDITLLKHEKTERELMKMGFSQSEAHNITSQKYNYKKESDEYYAEISKHNNE